MKKGQYRISVSMNENSLNQYEWEIVKFEGMVGWYKVKNGVSNSPDEAWNDAKEFIAKID